MTQGGEVKKPTVGFQARFFQKFGISGSCWGSRGCDGRRGIKTKKGVIFTIYVKHKNTWMWPRRGTKGAKARDQEKG
jgi:hypothetical protein